jgi:hypothetical protein
MSIAVKKRDNHLVDEVPFVVLIIITKINALFIK